MKRAKSYSEPDQGTSNTCALHTLARLFVHNVIQPDICPLVYHGEEIPPETDTLTSQCGDMIHTPEVERLTPEGCGGVRHYFSTLMYLYVYHCGLDHFPESVCDGAKLSVVSHTFIDLIQQKYIPPVLESKTEDILMVLPSHVYTTMFIMNHSAKQRDHPHVFNGFEDFRYRTFMDLCTKSGLYVGMILMKKEQMGHVLVVSEYTPQTNMYTIKNTWGMPIDKLHGSELKGPHYHLDKSIGEEDYIPIVMNDPIRGMFYMSTYPWEQMFIKAGFHPYERWVSKPNQPTRKSARKVGDVRVKTKSVSRRKSPKPSVSRSTTKFSNRGGTRAHSLHRRV
jgi:hypothetical protein